MSEAVPIWMENKPRCIAVTTAALWELAAAAAAAACWLSRPSMYGPFIGTNPRRSVVGRRTGRTGDALSF